MWGPFERACARGKSSRTLTFALHTTWVHQAAALWVIFMSSKEKFRFSIDRGGTFTDVYAECPGGKVCVLKLLSEDPLNYRDAPTEAIRRIIEQVYVEGLCC